MLNRAAAESKPAASPPSAANAPSTVEALVKIAAEYGHAMSNVGISKTVRADVTLAVPGFFPSASASMTIGLVDNQVSKAGAILETAFQRAFNDEAVEMERHLAISLQNTANDFNAR